VGPEEDFEGDFLELLVVEHDPGERSEVRDQRQLPKSPTDVREGRARM